MSNKNDTDGLIFDEIVGLLFEGNDCLEARYNMDLKALSFSKEPVQIDKLFESLKNIRAEMVGIARRYRHICGLCRGTSKITRWRITVNNGQVLGIRCPNCSGDTIARVTEGSKLWELFYLSRTHPEEVFEFNI